jgi:TrmH family RNA methyltransferase
MIPWITNRCSSISPRDPDSKKSGMITSAHNPKIQLVRNLLGRARERHESEAFVAEGVRLVEEALAAKWPFRFVLVGENLSQRGSTLVAELQSQQVEVEIIADPLLQSASETENSQGILAVLEYSHLPIPASLSFVLILDQIRDPGNLGTLLRTAMAAGVELVLLPPETADAFSPKVIRAGMGAHFRLPIHVLAWEEILTHLEGLQVYLADMEGRIPYWEADLNHPLALVVGGEADGASRLARELATSQLHIPMPGKSESLNAAVAGAILMFEVVRQRTTPRQERIQ